MDDQEESFFLPSSKFCGSKAGVAFKRGDRGLGYYPDRGGCVLQLHPLLDELVLAPVHIPVTLGVGSYSCVQSFARA